jgi:GTPase SAR1 family protein
LNCPKGFELLFNLVELPSILTSNRIDTKNDDDVITATVLLSELQTTLLNKSGSPCKVYSNDIDEGEMINYA